MEQEQLARLAIPRGNAVPQMKRHGQNRDGKKKSNVSVREGSNLSARSFLLFIIG